MLVFGPWLTLVAVACHSDVATEPADNGDATDANDVDAGDADMGETPVDGEVGSPPEPCGVEDDQYVGPCWLGVEGQQVSTLCDETSRGCFAPVADCSEAECHIPPASFLSGVTEGGLTGAYPTAITVVSRGFWIQRTEVTVNDWVKLIGYLPPNQPGCGLDCPVVNVNQFEVMEFANRVSAALSLEPCYALDGCGWDVVFGDDVWVCETSRLSGPSCEGYRLPTQAEWELAARAGSPYCDWTGPLPDILNGCETVFPEPATSWSCANSEAIYTPCNDLTHKLGPSCAGVQPVGRQRPNPFGLFDMAGNAEELSQTITGNMLARLPGAPPFEIRRDPGWSLEVTRASIIGTTGGAYYVSPGGVCGYLTLPFGVDGTNNSFRGVGFRLVRSDLSAPAGRTPTRP